MIHSSTVRRRVQTVLVILLVLAGGGIAYMVLRPRAAEPMYAGHPESYWLNSLSHGPWSIPDSRKLGTNELVLLTKAMEAKDKPLQRIYLEFWNKLPAIFRNLLPAPRVPPQIIRLTAGSRILMMGDAARPAIPELIRIAQDNPDIMIRLMAINCLGHFRNSDDRAKAALEEFAVKNPALRISTH